MKLIIDIPEDVLKTRYYTDYFGCGSHKLTETLDNATPIPDNAPTVDVLEQIRAEIQHLADLELLNMKLVLQIIDKHTKGDNNVDSV